jgi:glycosyltransferase involved in cell wall biosynthesis
MKITFLQSSLWLSGGARVIVEFANRLSQRGHALSIVIPKGTVSEELAKELNPSVNICEARVPLSKTIGAIDKLRLAGSMILAVPKSDVIIATHTPTTVVSLVSCALLRRGVPVWFYQDYPGMFANRPFEGWLLRHAYRWHRDVYVVSTFSAKEILDLGYKGQPVWVGEGLSNTKYFQPASRQNQDHQPKNKKTIFYLGDFRPRKGLADFLRACDIVYQDCKDIELWIASKEKGEIKTAVPYRFIFRPSLSELAECYHGCDLFVSSSWFEGFGLPPLEAMACGAPVVMTDSGGVQDYAKDEENCLLVPPREPELLAAAIMKVLANPEVEQTLRKNGPATAGLFTWERATDLFENALLKTISPSR